MSEMHEMGSLLSPAPGVQSSSFSLLWFSDLREVELLVEAGLTPLEGIKIAIFNDARFLGEDGHIGSITVGKQADLTIVRGNPALNISEIERWKSCSRME